MLSYIRKMIYNSYYNTISLLLYFFKRKFPDVPLNQTSGVTGRQGCRPLHKG